MMKPSHNLSIALPITQGEAETIAKQAAGTVFKKIGGLVEFDDLAQEAFIGIVKAAETFDETKSTFKTYALTKARFYLLGYLRDIDWMPRLERRLIKEGKVVERKLYSLNSLMPKNRNAGIDGDSKDEQFASYLGKYDDIHTKPHADEIEKVLRRAGGGDNARVLRAYYLEEMTMSQVAKRMGVSESRVSQIHSAAIVRARESMEEDER